MRFPKSLFNLLPMIALAGCASIVDGSNQTLSVTTLSGNQPVSGASCELKSNKGTWYVTTPGTVTVHRGYDALNATCTKAGYQTATQAFDSTTKGMAFGNLLFGGVIGAGVDMSTGAAYDYPDVLTVNMQPPAAISASGAPAPTAENVTN
ncbi:MAG TPA: hypothetical protein PLC74_01170 [Acetobacteraceae bacterium]|nr:hypothetical protein [Acetobacteraceae bacterium]